jgi:hypothetical protein
LRRIKSAFDGVKLGRKGDLALLGPGAAPAQVFDGDKSHECVLNVLFKVHCENAWQKKFENKSRRPGDHS